MENRNIYYGSGNAKEVISNEQLFSFVGNVSSYFVACYNNCGEDGNEIKIEKGVKFRGNFPNGPMFNIVSTEHNMHGKIIVGSVFGEHIFSCELTYNRFIENYVAAFGSSNIETMINEL